MHERRGANKTTTKTKELSTIAPLHANTVVTKCHSSQNKTMVMKRSPPLSDPSHPSLIPPSGLKPHKHLVGQENLNSISPRTKLNIN
jgi:hypothetical protein